MSVTGVTRYVTGSMQKKQLKNNCVTGVTGVTGVAPVCVRKHVLSISTRLHHYAHEHLPPVTPVTSVTAMNLKEFLECEPVTEYVTPVTACSGYLS